MIAKAGANALLIEYEDMFPYWGSIVNASALNAYTVNQIQELLNVAKTNQLEVIPLGTDFLTFQTRLKTRQKVALTIKIELLKLETALSINDIQF